MLFRVSEKPHRSAMTHVPWMCSQFQPVRMRRPTTAATLGRTVCFPTCCSACAEASVCVSSSNDLFSRVCCSVANRARVVEFFTRGGVGKRSIARKVSPSRGVVSGLSSPVKRGGYSQERKKPTVLNASSLLGAVCAPNVWFGSDPT